MRTPCFEFVEWKFTAIPDPIQAIDERSDLDADMKAAGFEKFAFAGDVALFPIVELWEATGSEEMYSRWQYAAMVEINSYPRTVFIPDMPALLQFLNAVQGLLVFEGLKRISEGLTEVRQAVEESR